MELKPLLLMYRIIMTYLRESYVYQKCSFHDIYYKVIKYLYCYDLC